MIKSVIFPGINILLLLAVFNSSGQPVRDISKGYTIDKTIKDSVSRKVKVLQQSILPPFELKVWIDDSLSYHSDARQPGDMQCEIYTILEKDTLKIEGYFALYPFLRFTIDLLKETCIVKFGVRTGARNATSGQNSSRSDNIDFPVKSCKLVLAQRPRFSKDELVDGYFEGDIQDVYWEAGGITKKFRITLKTYFRARPH